MDAERLFGSRCEGGGDVERERHAVTARENSSQPKDESGCLVEREPISEDRRRRKQGVAPRFLVGWPRNQRHLENPPSTENANLSLNTGRGLRELPARASDFPLSSQDGRSRGSLSRPGLLPWSFSTGRESIGTNDMGVDGNGIVLVAGPLVPSFALSSALPCARAD